jgi:hypothetical protein
LADVATIGMPAARHCGIVHCTVAEPGARESPGRDQLNLVSQCSTGWCSARLLALISSGLTIIYGTLGVLNLAHGAMFMLGGYAGFVAFRLPARLSSR